MKFINVLILLLGLASSEINASKTNELAIVVDAGDNQALITAIENANNGTGPDLIFIRLGPNGESTFTFTEPYMNSMAALPVISSRVEIFPIDSLMSRITFKRDLNAPQFRLATVSGEDGDFGLGVFNVESFSTSESGGAIYANQSTSVTLRGTNFSNNFASQEGGAIHMEGNSRLFVRGTGRLSARGPAEFKENRAGQLGGAISVKGEAVANITYVVFSDNTAGIFGCDINVNSTSNQMFGRTLILENCTFSSNGTFCRITCTKILL